VADFRKNTEQMSEGGSFGDESDETTAEKGHHLVTKKVVIFSGKNRGDTVNCRPG